MVCFFEGQGTAGASFLAVSSASSNKSATCSASGDGYPLVNIQKAMENHHV